MNPDHDVRVETAAWVVETFQKLGEAELLAYLRIEWNAKLRTTAGRALFKPAGPAREHCVARVELNPLLWARMNRQERYQTAVHEACHIVADAQTLRRSGRRAGHGRAWKALMVEMGLTPDRCHSFDTKGLSRRRVRAHCSPGCSVERKGARFFTYAKAQRVRQGERSYRCRTCRASITIDEESFEAELDRRLSNDSRRRQ